VFCLLLAPLLMPESYDWVKHTTSESGAQGIEGAWLARLGFVLYGIAVLLLVLRKQDWTITTRIIHFVFALGMAGNALFSSKPWLDELPFSVMEDILHSLMSGLVGTAFTLGVILLLLQRSAADWYSKTFDSFAIIISISVTLIMFNGGEDIAGIVQRIMFAVSYLWYAKEMMIVKN
jgi:hypothetical protein